APRASRRRPPGRRPRRGSSSRRRQPRSCVGRSQAAATIPRRMAPEDKPYRVYKGGRAKGGVPTLTRQPRPKVERRPSADGRPPDQYRGPGPVKRERRFGPGRIAAITVGVLILLLIGWTVAGYFAVRSGVKKANERLSDTAKAQTVGQDGLVLSNDNPAPRHGEGPTRGPGRVDALEPEHDPRARQRPLAPPDPSGEPARGLDHGHPLRPGAPHPLLPLDPARPRGGHPRPRSRQDQRGAAPRRPGTRQPERPRDA